MGSTPVVLGQLVLVGLPGSGKTTTGMALAGRLTPVLPDGFVDSDAELVRRTGRTIADLFVAEGEAVFRKLEEEVVADLCASHMGVIALGGGAVLSEQTRALLKTRATIVLEVSVAEGVRRTKGSGRPVLEGDDPVARYQELLEQRAPLYAEVASLVVPTTGKGSVQVADYIMEKIESGGFNCLMSGIAEKIASEH
jgi:shikimate kinase